jgi:hypothetical protein
LKGVQADSAILDGVVVASRDLREGRAFPRINCPEDISFSKRRDNFINS